MKKIQYAFLAFLFVLASSCSMDEKNYTDVEKETYMNTAEEAETVLLGIYSTMNQDGMYGYHLSLYFTLPSDIAKICGNELTNWRNVPCLAYTSTEDEIETTWACLYNAIYCANDFMEGLADKMGDYEDEDKELATLYMAEAHALRALFYFELVRWYGNVPLMTSTDQSNQHPSTYVQADPVEVYEFIENDLLYAIDVLPYACDDDIRDDNSFRFSKGGALGLLAKVYATWAGYPIQDESKWEDAAKTAKVLVESGKHSLLDDYETLWENSGSSTWDDSESLIEVSFYSATTNNVSGRIGKWNGVSIADGASESGRSAANWRAVVTYAQNWKDYDKDLRWSLTYADYKYTTSGKTSILTDGTFEDAMASTATASQRKSFNDALYPAKWDIEKYVTEENLITDSNFSNVNWYILRYADVLLLYAEALNEWRGAPTTDAYEAVNMVRRRGFGLDVNTTSSTADLEEGMGYEEFQQAVHDERGYELAFEGHRRQDLIRWGTFYEAIQQTYIDLQSWHESAADYYRCIDYIVEGKNELQPIPQHDMDLTNFTQNPGWE